MAEKLAISEYNKRKAMVENGFHWCTKCEEYLSLNNFSKSKSTEFGYYWWCKQCHSKSRKGNGNTQTKAKMRNRELKSYYKKLMGGKCEKCGYAKSQAVLDFHHVNPADKEASMATLISSNNHDRILLEIDKCVLLCKNCHMELEASVWEAIFIKNNGIGYKIDFNSIVENTDECWSKVSEKILFSQKSIFDDVLI